jgi:hypothetical protein
MQYEGAKNGELFCSSVRTDTLYLSQFCCGFLPRLDWFNNNNKYSGKNYSPIFLLYDTAKKRTRPTILLLLLVYSLPR